MYKVKYLKTKLKPYDGKIITEFYNNGNNYDKVPN